MKANASNQKVMSYGRMKEEEKRLKEEVKRSPGAGRGHGCRRGYALRSGSDRRRTASGVGATASRRHGDQPQEAKRVLEERAKEEAKRKGKLQEKDKL